MWYIQRMGYFEELLKKEMLSHAGTWKNPEDILSN